MQLFSPAFADADAIPPRYTRDADDLSPSLWWKELPAGTQELALIMDDPDAPRDEPFVHWVIYAIPATLEGLPEGLPRDPKLDFGPRQGRNDYGELGYGGPAPPPGTGVHRYRFELFALSRPLQAEPRHDHEALRAAMAGHILDRTLLMGTYRATAERV